MEYKSFHKLPQPLLRTIVAAVELGQKGSPNECSVPRRCSHLFAELAIGLRIRNEPRRWFKFFILSLVSDLINLDRTKKKNKCKTIYIENIK